MLEHGVSHLAILDADKKQGLAACEHLLALHHDNKPSVVFRQVDVSDEAGVNANVEDMASKFGGIDLLLCFAGITGSELSVEYDIQRWRKIFDVNLHGAFLVARSVARYKPFSNSGEYLLIKPQANDFKRDWRIYHLYSFHVRLRSQHTATTPSLCSLKRGCAYSGSLIGWGMGRTQDPCKLDIPWYHEHPSIRRTCTGRVEKIVAREVAHGYRKSRRPHRCRRPAL